MKLTKILLFSLIFMHNGILQVGPMLSKAPSAKVNHLSGTRNADDRAALHHEKIDDRMYVIINNNDRRLETCNYSLSVASVQHPTTAQMRLQEKKPEFFTVSPNAKVYSSDHAIQRFVFENCAKKFSIAIRDEDDEVGCGNSFHTLISVMDLYHMMRESQGSSTNHVRALCNGDYSESLKPLHWAVGRHANINIIQALLEYGADPNIINSPHGETPLDYALQRSYATYDERKINKEIIELLLKHGADVDKAQASTKEKMSELPFYQQLKKSSSGLDKESK